MISKNGAGIILLLVAQLLNLDVNETEIQVFIENSAEVIGFLLLVWNQLSRKDVKWGMWKTR